MIFCHNDSVTWECRKSRKTWTSLKAGNSGRWQLAGTYLLQIFMREASHLFRDPKAGPLFIELVQRKGDKGFGAGNFRALFESIERQHELEGRTGT